MRRKKLSQVGSNLALVIDRPMLDLLCIDGSTPLEIMPEHDGFRVRVISNEHTKNVLEDRRFSVRMHKHAAH